jgi:hypothetical protein
MPKGLVKLLRLQKKPELENKEKKGQLVEEKDQKILSSYISSKMILW